MDSAPNSIGESRKAYTHNNGQDSFWDCAPDEIIARILTFLPCSIIYLAQGVCRKWRSIIWSPLFMLLCKEWSQPRTPWLLEFQQEMYNQAWAFDLDGWQWFRLNFFFLPENAIILASSGGLVCLGRLNEEGYDLYICNPLTKKWRQLPSIPVYPHIVLLDVDHQANTYTIVALVFRGYARSSRPFGSVFVFDSKTWIWKETVGVPQEIRFASLCGTSLCCLPYTCRRVEMFDIVEAKWTQGIDIDMSPFNFKKAGKWVLLLPDGKSVLWYDVNARCWSSDFSANSILCAAPDYELEVYTVCLDTHGCYCKSTRQRFLLPESPLTWQNLQGRDIVIGAIWYEPHLGAMI